jgi:hypothetical protein
VAAVPIASQTRIKRKTVSEIEDDEAYGLKG